MKLLKIENLKKSKDGFLVIENINFIIKGGEICGIISDNHNNLSRLLNIVGGVDTEDAGKIYFKNRELSPVQRLRNVGIAKKNYQLIDDLTVLENIFLSSSWKYSRFGFISFSKLRRKANQILNKFQVTLDLRQKLRRLDHNEKILVEIARVLAMDCDYYIFDHITPILSLSQYDAFAGLVRELRNKGKCVILLPGTADDIRTFIDRLYLYKNSRLVELAGFKDMGDDKLNEILLSTEKLKDHMVFDPIYKAKAIMDERLNETNLDIKSIADLVSMGYETFRRKFKSRMGLSPNQYFIKIKIDKAKELLLYTNQEIKEIADAVGFSDPYYFSRIFKQKEKMAPAKFREKKMGNFGDEG
ncbi:MAG: helix-turn-helix domain-containing protein [Spirochaetales bacterium]|nr:helix-turn-helix domain-containing protein [Spirochaetales bacterium]